MSLDELTRRRFLRNSLVAAGAWVSGCGSQENAPDGSIADAGPCEDPFLSGMKVSDVPFVDDATRPFHVVSGSGWDGRLYTDLAELRDDATTIDNARFYIRTLDPDLLTNVGDWTIRLSGLVTESELTLQSLLPLEREMGTHLLECSGNSRGGGFGLMSACPWSGIPLAEVFASLSIQESATSVLISGFDMHSTPSAGGHSTPGASWIFPLESLMESGAFLATRMNGQPLPNDHGAPLRLLVPGWYGCANIKWVYEIRFVDDQEPATSQMQEFASRTHQDGVPDLARDFLPATLDVSAMPIRVEKWRVNEETRYRIVGIQWGGQSLDEARGGLEIKVGSGPRERVAVCPLPSTHATWTLWEHAYVPSSTGRFAITLHVPEPSIRTRRLDRDFYLREIEIDEI